MRTKARVAAMALAAAAGLGLVAVPAQAADSSPAPSPGASAAELSSDRIALDATARMLAGATARWAQASRDVAVTQELRTQAQYHADAAHVRVNTHAAGSRFHQASAVTRRDTASAFQAALDELGSATGAWSLAQEQLDIASQAVAAAQRALDDAQRTYSRRWLLLTPTAADAQSAVDACSNSLVRLLYNVGFRGVDLREAWAVAMRESGGRADAVSATNDWGVFQLNKTTFADQAWWDDAKMLDRQYNATVAFRISQGGKSWINWGLDGHGNANPLFYRRAGWSSARIQAAIVAPYQRYYAKFPCDQDTLTGEVVPDVLQFVRPDLSAPLDASALALNAEVFTARSPAVAQAGMTVLDLSVLALTSTTTPPQVSGPGPAGPTSPTAAAGPAVA